MVAWLAMSTGGSPSEARLPPALVQRKNDVHEETVPFGIHLLRTPHWYTFIIT